MFARRVLLATAMVVGVLLGLVVLWQIREVVVLMVIAIVFGAAIRPPVLGLNRRGVPLALAVLAVYLALGVVLALVLWLVVPPFVVQVREFIAALPRYIAMVQERFQDLEDFAGQLPFLPAPADLAGQLGDGAGGLIGGLAGGIYWLGRSVVGAAFSFLLLLVITLYWITEREDIIDRWLRLAPLDRRRTVRAVLREIDEKLGAYVRGQLLLGLIVGILAFIALTVLQIPFPVPLAVFAGVTELIPLVGPFLGAIPAVIVALAIDPLHAVLVALAYLLIQQLENHLLVPQVMRRAVGLSPLTILLSILIGTTLFGFVGALLAVPVASIGAIVLERTLFRTGAA